MQDPSQGVAPQLQSHMHLISGHRFPLLPQLSMDQAFRYLLDAPTIVKQTAPMSWTYVTAPQDGTLWLEWIPPRTEYRFPSDGYVWGDPEQSFQQDFGGYTIEILRHLVGFRPGFDPSIASHARTRYHFRTKNPNVAAAHPDSHLWIVHYHQTDQNHMMPISQLQLQPVMRQIMSERKWLESQGRLERKDFMLHDREHWPQISLPGGAPQQQGMYGNPMMQQQQQQMNQQRFPQYQYTQGQPPAKRPRHSGPSGMPGSADGGLDTSIEDEENTSLGDFFDHLSPREISMMRYMQHHRWMEEVFSSPYASAQIVPPDLGLGLMGELKGLTDGILDPPSAEEAGKALEKPSQAKEAQPFTNLKKEQLDEFNKRVEKHLEDGRAEIERMKKEHAEKMAEWKKTKTLMSAEKRLRNATWEGHESAVPVYRLDVASANGHAEEVAAETVEDVVEDVESAFGVKIESHKESSMVEKGGLDEEQQREEPVQQDMEAADADMSGMQQQEPMMSGANNAEPEPQSSYQRQVSSEEEAAQSNQPPATADAAQPSFELDDQQDYQDDDIENEAAEAMDQSALDDMVDMGDDSMMNDMDMDVDDGGMEFIENDQTPGDDIAAAAAADVPGLGEDLSTPQQDDPLQAEDVNVAATAALEPTAASPVTLGGAGEQEAPSSLDQLLPTTTTVALATTPPDASTTILPAGTVADLDETSGAAPTTDLSSVNDVTTAEDVNATEDNSLFDDGTFDDLGNMDGGAGDEDDGLIDFDGGMGMEDSAFGDAMHGMDTHTPLSGLGEEQGGG